MTSIKKNIQFGRPSKIWLLVIPCLCAVFMAAQARSDEAQVDTLLKHFESVVFGSEYDSLLPEGLQIKKWVGPIRIGLNAMAGEVKPKPGGGRELKLKAVRPSKTQVDLVRKHLTTLIKLTGVKNERADKASDKPANLVIRFVPRLAMGQPFIAKDFDPELLAKLGRSGVCYFVTSAIRSGAMFRGLIVVNNELPPDQMDACLLEEMTQVMGLPNDSDIVTPSIFNQMGQTRALNKTDVILLTTLYDRRLPAGTPRDDALRIARDILAEKLAE